jgi:hypothetical protein
MIRMRVDYGGIHKGAMLFGALARYGFCRGGMPGRPAPCGICIF